MGGGERVGGGVERVVADELKKRTVVGVAAGFGQNVDLGCRMAEFGRIHAGLHFKFLQGIDRGKNDVGVEIWIGVHHTVQRVVVIHDAVPARRDGLVGAIAALTPVGLPGRWRKIVHIRRQGHQIQVLTSIEWKLYNDFVVDHHSDGRVFGLQHSGGGGDLNGFAHLAELEREIQTHCLLHLELHVGGISHFEARMFDLEIVNAGRQRGERVQSVAITLRLADRVGCGAG